MALTENWVGGVTYMKKSLRRIVSLMLVGLLLLLMTAIFSSSEAGSNLPPEPLPPIVAVPMNVTATTPQRIHGSISSIAQVNDHTFTPTLNGSYRFVLSGLTNGSFRVSIYDSNGFLRADDSWMSNDSAIALDLTAGQTYTIRIRNRDFGSLISPYTLTIWEQKPTVNITGFNRISDSLQFTNQVNIYSYTASRTGSYRFVLSGMTGNGSLRVSIYDSNGFLHADEDWVFNGDGIPLDLTAGETYTIRIRNRDFGSLISPYTLTIERPEISTPPTPVGNSKNIPLQTRSPLSLGLTTPQRIHGGISDSSQVDAHPFTATLTGSHRFVLSGLTSGSLRVSIYDSNGFSLDNDSWMSNGSSIALDLTAGETYTIRIRNRDFGSLISPYTLTIWAQKPTVNISGYNQISDSIQFVNQVNIYTYTATRTGSYRFAMSGMTGNGSLRVSIYDSNGFLRADDSWMSNDSAIALDLTAGETYTIRIRNRDFGSLISPYTLTIWEQKPTVNISGYNQISDSIQFVNQVNIYEYNATRTGSHQFVMSGMTGNSSLRVSIYDSNGLRHANEDWMWNGTAITLYLTAGQTYIIRVRNRSAGSVISPYTLISPPTPTPQDAIIGTWEGTNRCNAGYSWDYKINVFRNSNGELEAITDCVATNPATTRNPGPGSWRSRVVYYPATNTFSFYFTEWIYHPRVGLSFWVQETYRNGVLLNDGNTLSVNMYATTWQGSRPYVFHRTSTAASCDWGRLFRHNADEYYHPLATRAAQLSELAYNRTGIRDNLAQQGFQSILSFEYESSLVAAHTIAYREIIVNGQQRNLIVVAVRGTVGEFGAIFNNIIYTPANHLGYLASASVIRENLSYYINNPFLQNQANNIVLITGHSQGGAVANILAASLNDASAPITTGQNNIFAYTFAAPRVTNNRNIGGHSNIFNMLNSNDLIPHYPPHLLFRHGQNFRLPMTQTSNITGIPIHIGHHHGIAQYRAWMQSHSNLTQVQLNQMMEGSLPSLVRINSPVDIRVYNSQGNLAGQIANNTASAPETSEVFAWVTEDGAKQFFLPYGDTYTLRFMGTGAGTMSYTVETLDILADEPNAIKAFENVRLYAGRQMVSEVVDTPDVRLLFQENGQTVGEIAQDGTETRFPAFTITAAPTAPSFGSHQVGYVQRPTQTITITNTGNQNVTLNTLPTIANWTLAAGANWNTAMAPGQTRTFTLRPNNGLAVGTYNPTITITGSNGISAQIQPTFTVTAISVTGITIPGAATRNLTAGQTLQLSATVAPTNATNQAVTWNSNNTAVATVNANGLVTTTSAGTATITVTTQDGSRTAQVTVTVTAGGNNGSTTPPPPPANTIFGTRWEATILNWILFFLGFGWIWMWF